MRRAIKWIIIVVIILLIFPGILPAIDRFCNNIGMNIPSFEATFNMLKGKTEDTINKGKDFIEGGVSNVQDFVNDIPSKIEINKDKNKPSNTEEIDALIARVEIAEPNKIKYSRDEWDKPVKKFDGMSLRNYGTKNSQWLISWDPFKYKDPYTNNEITDLPKLDWDHIIPLNYVNQHGGSEWSNDKKHSYAYDIQIGVSVHQTENRKKSDKGPSQYMPPKNQSAYCYTWFTIADQWDISMTQADVDVCRKAIYNDLDGAYLIIN